MNLEKGYAKNRVIAQFLFDYEKSKERIESSRRKEKVDPDLDFDPVVNENLTFLGIKNEKNRFVTVTPNGMLCFILYFLFMSKFRVYQLGQ